MIKVYISGNRADVIEREPLTSGTVGKVINFAFTEDWRPLIKYAVFEGSGRRKTRTNIGDSCIIPHEVLAKHGGALRVGVYGRTADGSAATPTVYAQLGIIQRGADPNADPSTKPTLPVWAQLQAQIGDLSNLTTGDKTSLVAAINEVAKSGGGSGGGKDGTGIESITYKGEDESGGNMYTVLLTDGTSYDITAPKGAAGAAGAAGADGITPHIGDNGNWYLGTTDTGKPSRGDKGEDAAADRTLGLTGATVGQIAKIAAVDASGVPTAWSPVDMPTGGGDEWVKVAEATLTEVVNEIRLNFDPCKAVYIEFQYGAVENDLGVIGIYPNPKTPPYTGEDRAAAVTQTTSNTNKRGYMFCTIDRRHSSMWLATSQTFYRGDGAFGSITPGALMNCEIRCHNDNTWASLISPDYLKGADYINAMCAFGAGMNIGTTLKVWGVKA